MHLPLVRGSAARDIVAGRNSPLARQFPRICVRPFRKRLAEIWPQVRLATYSPFSYRPYFISYIKYNISSAQALNSDAHEVRVLRRLVLVAFRCTQVIFCLDPVCFFPYRIAYKNRNKRFESVKTVHQPRGQSPTLVDLAAVELG